MKWNCEGEHKPTVIGENVYCAKCGTKFDDDAQDEEGEFECTPDD